MITICNNLYNVVCKFNFYCSILNIYYNYFFQKPIFESNFILN
jgi:hypothetical protein